MDIKIRGLDPVIIRKIDELAKKHHISREEYLRRNFVKYAIIQDVEELDNKYAALVELLAERLAQANDVIEMNTVIMEKMIGMDDEV